MKKIAVIRISGKVNLAPGVKRTLEELRLKKKFSCIIIEEKPELVGMVEKVKDFVTYGEVSENTIKEMKEKRKSHDNVFHLHPPRGGLRKSTKLAWPKGILGKNDKINELLLRML